MTQAFLTALLVNTAVFSVLFGLMLAARKLLSKRISAVLQYMLWAVVVIKLIIPFGFESNLSPFALLTADAPAAAVQPQTADGYTDRFDTGGQPLLYAEDMTGTEPQLQDNPATPEVLDTEPAVPANSPAAAQPLGWADWGLIVWAAGALTTAAVTGLHALRLRRRIRCSSAVPPESVMRICEQCRREQGLRRKVRVCVQPVLRAPAVMGVLRPLLALPEDMHLRPEDEVRHVFLHELTHLKRGDLAVILLLNVLTAVYWFNPFVWLCFSFIRKDMESACDQRVLEKLGAQARQDYICTVLRFAKGESERRLTAAMGMADGRLTMEQRIRGMFRQTRTGVKGRTLALGLALLMLAAGVLTACQPTPEAPPVMNKRTDIVDTVQEAAAEPEISAAPMEDRKTIAERIGETGGRMTLELMPSDSVTIKVDADIVTPEFESIPMVRVKPENFSAEQFGAFIDYLTNGLPVYYQPNDYSTSRFTKEELVTIATQIRKYLTDDDLPRSTKNAWEYWLDEFYQSEYDSALSQTDDKPYDGKLVSAENNGTFSSITSLKCYMGKTRAAWLSLWQTMEGNDTELQFDNSDYGSGYNTFEPYTGVQAARVGMTYEEARTMAENLVRRMDGEDTNLVVFESSIGYQLETIANYTKETSPQAYVFKFGRSYNGAVAKNVNGLWGGEDNIDYSKRVAPENLMVIIDSGGFRDVYWSSYTKYVENVSDDVPLKDFDSIREVFENYCRYKFAWTYRNDALAGDATPAVTLNVKRIEMNLMVIPEKDDLDSYVTVPVWDFIADMTIDGDTMTQEGFADPGQTNISIMTINAIDGTVINRVQGY